MAPVTSLQWSLASTFRRPEGWIAALLTLVGLPALLAVPQISIAQTTRGMTAISYELAFVASLAGAALACARLATLERLDPWFTRAQRWASDAVIVMGHGFAFGLLSWWFHAGRTSSFDWKAGLIALALTAGFWAGIVRVTRSLSLSALVQLGVLSAIGVLVTLGVQAIPSPTLLSVAHMDDGGASIVMSAALAGDLASIISLFLVAWCVESPLLRRS